MFVRLQACLYLALTLFLAHPVRSEAAESRVGCGALLRAFGRAYRTAKIALGRATPELPPEVYAIFYQSYEAHRTGKEFVASPQQYTILGKWKEMFDEYNGASTWMHLLRRVDRARALLVRSDLKLRTVTWQRSQEELLPLWQVVTNLRRNRAYKIYEKIMRDANAELTEKERATIRRLFLETDLESFRAEVRRGVLPEGLASTDGAHALVRSWGAQNRRALARALIEFARLNSALGLRIAHFLLPLPRRPLAEIKKEALIKRMLETPDFTLRPNPNHVLDLFAMFSDETFAKKYHLTDPGHEEIARFLSDRELHGAAFARLARLRRAGLGMKWGIVLSAIALGILPLKFMSTDESLDEGLDEDEDGVANSDKPGFRGLSRNQSDRVTLIFTSPMPHVSIRIGGLIYNYGVGDVTRFRLSEYKARVGFGGGLSGNHTRVELDLSDEQRKRLRDVLEQDVNRGHYVLAFPFNDCVAMTNRALREGAGIYVPPVADRSQALTIAYFGGQYLLGSTRVRGMSFAAREGNTGPLKTLDAGVNIVDSLYFLGHAKNLLLWSRLYDRAMGAQ